MFDKFNVQHFEYHKKLVSSPPSWGSNFIHNNPLPMIEVLSTIIFISNFFPFNFESYFDIHINFILKDEMFDARSKAKL